MSDTRQILDPARPWERLCGGNVGRLRESPDAYFAFTLYSEMDPGERSLQVVAEGCLKKKATIKQKGQQMAAVRRWAREYLWIERAASWDAIKARNRIADERVRRSMAMVEGLDDECRALDAMVARARVLRDAGDYEGATNLIMSVRVCQAGLLVRHSEPFVRAFLLIEEYQEKA